MLRIGLKRGVQTILLLLVAAGSAGARKHERREDPLEGIVAEVNEKGETMYQPRPLAWPEPDIFLSAFLVRSGSDTRRLFLAVVLRGVETENLAPLNVTVDGSSFSLPLASHPKIDRSGCDSTAEQIIADENDLVLRISRAGRVDLAYTAPGYQLKSSLAPDDQERFQRVSRLYGLADLPPAPRNRSDANQDADLFPAIPEGVTSPELIEGTKTDPAFPQRARALQKKGTVVLKARILEDGTVGTLQPVRVYPRGCGFAEAAMEAVRTWRYRPALKHGKPIEMDFTVIVNFALETSVPRVADFERLFGEVSAR